jgi:hypothetical protein
MINFIKNNNFLQSYSFTDSVGTPTEKLKENAFLDSPNN